MSSQNFDDLFGKKKNNDDNGKTESSTTTTPVGQQTVPINPPSTNPFGSPSVPPWEKAKTADPPAPKIEPVASPPPTPQLTQSAPTTPTPNPTPPTNNPSNPFGMPEQQTKPTQTSAFDFVPQEAPRSPAQMMQQQEKLQPKMDIQPETTAKQVFLFYGHKGTGKTKNALSFPGSIVALSFDRKTGIVKEFSYNNDSRISVYDMQVDADYGSPEAYLESSEACFRRIDQLMDQLAKSANKPDWILIDGSEMFQVICEMTMRARNNIMPFAGIPNPNLWKERRLYIRQIHQKAMNIANKGIIYTTYVEKDEIFDDVGNLKTRKDVPKWIDVIMTETDEVIKTYSVSTKDGKVFMADVESSKFKPQLSGKILDVNNKSFWEVRRSWGS